MNRTITFLHDQNDELLLDQRGNALEAQWSPVSMCVEYYDGRGWVDITGDTLVDSLRMRRGINSNFVTDRIAQTGTLDFQLVNAITNHGGLLGYYSPDNANIRTGFSIGAPVRFSIGYNSTKIYRFYGRIKSIEPQAGKYLGRRVNVKCVDYMDYLASTKINLLQVQANRYPSEVIGYVISELRIPPLSEVYYQDNTALAYALTQEADEKTTPMTVISKVCKSTLGYFYVGANSLYPEILVYQTRHTREARTASELTLNDNMHGLSISTNTERLRNLVKVSTYPPKIDTSYAILYTNPSEFEIAGSTTYSQTWTYKDPNGKATRVSGSSMVTPVSGTDYRFSISSGGTGSDANGYVTVTVTFGGNSAHVTIVNNFPTSVYCNLFQLRGIGYYYYDPSVAIAEDTDSQDTYGERELSVIMPYQSDPNIGAEFASWILNKYKNELSNVESVTITAGRDSSLWPYLVSFDIANRITVVETVTGLNREFFINAIDYSIKWPDTITCTWALEDVSGYNLWILGDTDYSVLGTTTILTV